MKNINIIKNLIVTMFVFFFILANAIIGEASPRIGVMEFKNTTDYRYRDLESNIEDMLITELVNTGKFDVIERSQMTMMLGEQQKGATGIIDPATAIQFGKIHGVQYLLYGRITNVSTAKSGGGFGGIVLAQSNVKVNVTVRLVNAATGSIALASNAVGSVTLTAAGMQGAGSGGRTDVSAQDIQKAAEKAVKQIAVELAANAGKI